MAYAKTTKIIFWVSTSLLFLMEGVMPALTGHTEMAKEGIRHLGYPPYFGTLLVVFKVLGATALILPMIPPRIKEWAYAGLAVVFISAFVSHAVVDGINGQAFFPLIALAVLITSYISYHRLHDGKSLSSTSSTDQYVMTKLT